MTYAENYLKMKDPKTLLVKTHLLPAPQQNQFRFLLIYVGLLEEGCPKIKQLQQLC